MLRDECSFCCFIGLVFDEWPYANFPHQKSFFPRNPYRANCSCQKHNIWYKYLNFSLSIRSFVNVDIILKVHIITSSARSTVKIPLVNYFWKQVSKLCHSVAANAIPLFVFLSHQELNNHSWIFALKLSFLHISFVIGEYSTKTKQTTSFM